MGSNEICMKCGSYMHWSEPIGWICYECGPDLWTTAQTRKEDKLPTEAMNLDRSLEKKRP